MVFQMQNDECKSQLNPFTLSFRDRGLNVLYARDYIYRSLNFGRVSLFLAIAIYMLFSFLDSYIMPSDAANRIMIFRLVGVGYFIIGIALTYYRKVQKYYQLLMIGIMLTGGGNIIFMIMVSEQSGGYFYYAGLLLAIIYAHSLLRLRFIAAAFSTWILIIAYAVTAISSGITPEGIFVSNMFFLVSANILGMFASYGIEYYMRMSFLRNLMLQEKTKLLEAEHKRKSKELEDARLIQLSMLPKNIPEHPLYDISFIMKTASEVGGDFYDLLISEDGTITFAVGDATGHGAKAGAMVTAMKFLFSNYAKDMDIVDFLKKADHSLRQMRLPRLFMSFTIGRIKGDTLEVAGVGMPALTMFNSSANKLCKLSLKGFPLGSQNDFEYKKHSTTISENDVLFVMTDGLPELFNSKKETIGYEKVERTFLSSAVYKSEEIIGRFLDMAEEWRKDYPLQDDITLLVIKRKEKKHAVVLVDSDFNTGNEEQLSKSIHA